MNLGKIIIVLLLLCAFGGGAGLYYLQVYYFYEEVVPTGADVQLVAQNAAQSETISYSDFSAIDASSSPIRFRACFTTDQTRESLVGTYVVVDSMEPRIAPGWFDCFDAEAIGTELTAGTATAFLGTKNIAFGVDRIVAITDSGHGYIWHEPNECGAKAYDGSPTGEACPDRPQSTTGTN